MKFRIKNFELRIKNGESMDLILNTIKKIIPKSLLEFIRPAYHKTLANAAAFWHGYPAEKMIVIGVTGTNGKSTTTELIARVLGYAKQPQSSADNGAQREGDPSHEGGARSELTRMNKVGFASTAKFKVGDKEWLNDKKMTMLGRFALQKLLRDMANAGCKYAVIETSSEGIKQARHIGINYDYLVFTNLTPEHIESHGSFEKYKEAKLELFRHLERSERKKFFKQELRIKNQELRMGNSSESMESMREDDASKTPPRPSPTGDGALIPKVIIVNRDDKYAGEFLNFDVDEKVVYGIKPPIAPPSKGGAFQGVYADDVRMDKNGIDFKVYEKRGLTHLRGQTPRMDGFNFKLNMIGRFNVYNAMPAIIIGRLEGMGIEGIKEALEKIKGVPGRMEFIDEGQDFSVLIDYAPEPESMKKLYEALGEMGCGVVETGHLPDCVIQAGCPVSTAKKNRKIIHVLGSCGGGRDKARRRVLGKMAAENADVVIVTNEDPYDDDPMEIINEVASGAENSSKFKVQSSKFKVFKILDRREAIRKALELAEKGDLVLITGKGAEQAICVADGKKISWDDREAVRLEFRSKK